MRTKSLLGLSLALLGTTPHLALGQTGREALQAHMAEHLDAARAIQHAVVSWDLQLLADRGTWLSQHLGTPGLPPGAAEYTRAMRLAAGRAGQATEPADAGAALGEMALACGACHARWEVKPPLVGDLQPPSASGTAGHMAAHAWGAERLWEGLIAPSGAAWTAGAQSFNGDPLVPESLGPNVPDPDMARQLAQRAHQIAGEAAGTSDVQQRAALYGQLVATCAQCHTALDVASATH